jgi:putative SOS response-associated peptidase YedK
MCNLYRMTKATAEIAHLFGAWAGQGANFAAEVYPGYPGLVVAEGEARVAPRVFRSRSRARADRC